jgi:hypothetical protein
MPAPVRGPQLPCTTIVPPRIDAPVPSAAEPCTVIEPRACASPRPQPTLRSTTMSAPSLSPPV